MSTVRDVPILNEGSMRNDAIATNGYHRVPHSKANQGGDEVAGYCKGAMQGVEGCTIELRPTSSKWRACECRVPEGPDQCCSYQGAWRKGWEAQLNRINAMSINLLESVQNGVNYSIRNVFMPLFECVDKHGLLLVGDLSRRRFFVYDILVTKRAPTRTNLMNSAKDEVAAALSTTTQYSDARSWDAERALCPQQENGHDCGVFVMVFMDVLPMRAKHLVLDQLYVRQVRENLLLSLL